MQTSCFFVSQYLNSEISITADGGSDFLYSQILASSEQISSFFRMLGSASRHTYTFISSEPGITLLHLN